MICYLDADGYLLSINPIDGGIEVDAPDLKFGTSQHRLVNGVWEISDVVPQRVLDEVRERTARHLLTSVRKKRDALLVESDWTQIPDVPEAIKSKWVTYRQNLRDITTQPDLANVAWPSIPD